LRYFTDFGKPAFQHITAPISAGIYARVYCILQCVYDVVVKKFTFAISSFHEFIVLHLTNNDATIAELYSNLWSRM